MIKPGETTLNPGLPVGRIEKSAPTPPKNEVQKRFIAAKEAQVINTTAEAGITGKTEPRMALLTISKFILESLKFNQGAESIQKLIENNKALVGSITKQLEPFLTSEDPKNRALAIDFQKAMSQQQAAMVDVYIGKFKEIVEQEGLDPQIRSSYEASIEKLNLYKNGKTTEKGEVVEKGLVHEIDQFTTDRGKIAGSIPNSFTELVQTFEIPQSEAESNPLGAFENMMQNMIKNKTAELVLSVRLKKKGVSSEVVNIFRDTLRVMRGEAKTKEKVAKFALKGSIFALIASLALAFVAGKNSQEQQGYGGH